MHGCLILRCCHNILVGIDSITVATGQKRRKLGKMQSRRVQYEYKMGKMVQSVQDKLFTIGAHPARWG